MALPRWLWGTPAGDEDDASYGDEGFADVGIDDQDQDGGGPFGGEFIKAQLGGIVGGAARAAPRMSGGPISAAGRVIGNLVYSMSGKVRGIVARSGEFFTSKKVADLAQRFGLEMAAAGLGVGLLEVAQAVFSHHRSRRRRRGRGITARDMRTSSRTIRKLSRMHHMLASLAAQGVRHARRSQRLLATPSRETIIAQR